MVSSPANGRRASIAISTKTAYTPCSAIQRVMAAITVGCCTSARRGSSGRRSILLLRPRKHGGQAEARRTPPGVHAGSAAGATTYRLRCATMLVPADVLLPAGHAPAGSPVAQGPRDPPPGALLFRPSEVDGRTVAVRRRTALAIRGGGASVARMTVLGSAPRRMLTGLLVGAVGIVVVTGVIAALKNSVDPIGLTGLYLFAILPLAIFWGFAVAGIVTVAAYLAFAFFVTEPLYSLSVASGDTVAAFVIAIIAAYVVSELARRANERAREAQARAKEAEEAQLALSGLADEQAALRRVATLVVHAGPTSEVFEAVTREVGLRCDADLARMERFESDHTVTAIAAWSRSGEAQLAVGTRFPLEGASIAAQVYDTGRPARVDSFAGASGPIAHEAQALGIRASVGCPIVVGGATWGVIAASNRRETPFPPGTESQIADFTEVVATAVANAEAQAELVASRARLLTAGDEARRQVVRDLHDGAQQRLVHTILTLKFAQRAQEADDEAAKQLVGEALVEAQEAITELREL